MSSCNFHAPNGENSILYAGLEQKYGPDQATQIWNWTKTDSFEGSKPMGVNAVLYDSAEVARIMKGKTMAALSEIQSDIDATNQLSRLKFISQAKAVQNSLNYGTILLHKKTGNLYTVGGMESAESLRGEALLSYLEDGLNPSEYFLYDLDPIILEGDTVHLGDIDNLGPLFGASEERIASDFVILGEFTPLKDINDEPTLDEVEARMALSGLTSFAKKANTVNIYSSDKKYGLLSNFGPKPFTATVKGVDGRDITLKFPTVEHYFQVRKALFSGDPGDANNIYQAPTAMKAKSLGRQVKMSPQKVEDWDVIAYDVLLEGMQQSFAQNPQAVALLLSTGDAELTHIAPGKTDLGRWATDFPKALTTIRSAYQQKQQSAEQEEFEGGNSGGAGGADTEWDQIGRRKGFTKWRHWREKRMDKKGNPIKHPDSDTLRDQKIEIDEVDDITYAEGKAMADRIDALLGEDPKRGSAHYRYRNYAQVKHSDAVFAISSGFGYRPKMRQRVFMPMDRGTVYAIMGAIFDGKPVFVFDQQSAKWYTYNRETKKFEEYNQIPILTKSFAGVGTRTINEAGKKAIEAVYDATIAARTTQSKVQRTNKLILRDEVKANPRTLYLFGDNTDRKGLGGQAKEMRGEPNAHGIVTKRHPNNEPGSFLTDATLEQNNKQITADIDAAIVKMKSGAYDKVVIPQIGIGKAKLPEKAPRTWEHLQSELKRLEAVIKGSTPVLIQPQAENTDPNRVLLTADRFDTSSLEAFNKSLDTIYEEARNNPEMTFEMEFTPAHVIFIGEQKLTGVTLAALLDREDAPFNVVYNRAMFARMQNLPKRFLQGTVLDTPNPLNLDEVARKKQMDMLFIQVRNEKHEPTGEYFSIEKQNEAIDSILYQFYLAVTKVKAGEQLNVRTIREQIYTIFNNGRTHLQRIANGQMEHPLFTRELAAEQVINFTHVLNSFYITGERNNLWNFMVEKLNSYGIRINRDGNVQEQATDQVNSSDETLMDQILEEAGDGLKDWSDNSFELDQKDTASTRMKLFLLSVVDSYFTDEVQPKQIDLFLTQEETRKRIVQGLKKEIVISGAAPDVLLKNMGIKAPESLSPNTPQPEKDKFLVKTALIEGKLYRLTVSHSLTAQQLAATRFAGDTETFAQRIEREEGRVPQIGDLYVRLEPYEQRTNLLQERRNYLHMPKLADYELLFQDLIGLLANREPSFENYVKAMEESSSPNIRQTARKLRDSAAHVQKEFVAVMSTHYQRQIMVLFRKGKDGHLDARLIDSNRANELQTIQRFWQENQKNSPMLVRDATGHTVVNRELAKEFWDELQSIYNTKITKGYTKDELADLDKKLGYKDAQKVKDVRRKQIQKERDALEARKSALFDRVMELNGILLDPKAKEDLYNNIVRLTKGLRFNSIFAGFNDKGQPMGLMDILIHRLYAATEETIDDEEVHEAYMANNPLYTEKTAIGLLAKVQATYTPTLYSQTHKSAEGKTIYSFGLNTALSHAVRKLKEEPSYRERYQHSHFASRSWLLQELSSTTSNHLDRFQMAYLDGLKNEFGNRDGIVRADMSDREQWLMALSLFQNKGSYTYAHYVSMTHSDKTKTPVFLNAPRKRRILEYRQGKLRYTNDVLESMYEHLFMAEYNRMTQPGGEDIKGYAQGKKLFYFFPKLNHSEMVRLRDKGIIKPEEFNAMWNKEGNIQPITTPGLQTIVLKLINMQLNEMVNQTVNSWTESKLLDNGMPGGKKYYKRLLADAGIQSVTESGETIHTYPDNTVVKAEDITRLAAADYTINSLLFNASLAQLFFGDPALTYKNNLSGTFVEYGKRLAKDIAPGKDGEFSHSPTYVAITAVDFQPEVKELSKRIAAYSKVEATDAQEITTMQEHLDVLYAFGRVSKSQYEQATGIISRANGGYYRFPAELESIILQPMKPVATGLRDAQDGVMNYDYVKSSSYPLYPPVTRGLELDKLRRAMEVTGVQRLNFASAKKIGSPKNMVTLFKADGSIDEAVFTSDNWLEASRQVMDRSEFRIQQEVPYDAEKDQILTVSQMNKLVVEKLATIAKPFNYRGTEQSGAQLRTLKENLRKQLINRSHQQFLEKIGAHYDAQRDQLVFSNKRKFYELLAEEAASRDGYTLNDVMALKSFVNDSDELTIPLSFTPSASRFEGLMMSLIQKIVKIKMPGHSFVQASPAGFQSMATWEEANLSHNDIVWTRPYTGPLQTAHINEAGEVVPAQVLVGFNYFTDRGERIDIRDYTIEENGKKMLDTQRIPRELFQMIGARIPNQGHSSMLPIEIVGFLPQNMGDMIVVPAAITKQMGADFDVDKLYTYHRAYKQDNTVQLVDVQKTREFLGANTEEWTELKEATINLLKQEGIKPGSNGRYSSQQFNQALGRAVKTRYPDGNVPKHTSTYTAKEEQVVSTRLIPIGYNFTDPNAQPQESEEVAPLDYDDSFTPLVEEHEEEEDLKNQYFDIHWSVLTHPDVFDSMMAPLDKPDASQEAELLNPNKGLPYYFSPAYQLEDFQSMKGAKILVAQTSLALTHNAVMQDKNIWLGELTLDEEGKPIMVPAPIRIGRKDGSVLELTHLSGYGETTYQGKKRTKADNIQIQQSESVDHAKNRVIDKLNLDPNTASTSLAISRLQSADQGTPGEADFKPGQALSFDFNARLLMQPIVREYAAELARQNDSLSSNFSADINDRLVKELQDKYVALAMKEAGAEGDWESFVMEQLTKDREFVLEVDNRPVFVADPETLLETIQMTPGVQFYMRQFFLLSLYRELEVIGDQLVTIQSVTSQDTRGAGKDMLSAIQTEEKRTKLGVGADGRQIVGVQQLFKGAEPTEVGAIYQATVDTALALYEDILPYEKLNGLYEYFAEQSGKPGKTTVSNEQKQIIFNAVKAYVFSSSQLALYQDPYAERMRLLFSQQGSESLARRVQKAKNSWARNNYFVQRLQPVINPDGLYPDTIEYNAAKASMADDYENTKAWLDMFNSTDPQIKALAEDLLRYLYVTGGQQGARNFVKYIPWSVLEGSGIAIGIRESFERVLGAPHMVAAQIYQHNPRFARQLQEGLPELGSPEMAPDDFLLPMLDLDKEGPASQLAIMATVPGLAKKQRTYPDFLSYRQDNSWILYQRMHMMPSGEELYVRLDTLGSSKDSITEYSWGVDQARSVFAENRAPWFEAMEPVRLQISNFAMDFKAIPTIEKNLFRSVGIIAEQGGWQDLTNALSVISSDPQQPHLYRELSKVLSEMDRNPAEHHIYTQIFGLNDTFHFELETMAPHEMGDYNPGNNTLRLNAIGIPNKTTLTETVLHELMHYHTSMMAWAIDETKWTNLDEGTKTALRKIKGYLMNNPELDQKIRDVEAIRKEVFDRFKAMVIAASGQEALDEAAQMKGKYAGLYYGLSSLPEFFSHVLTNPEVMDFLNRMDYKGKKSMLEHLKELFSKLWAAMLKTVGAREGSYLEEAAKRVLDVTMHRQMSVKSNQPTQAAASSTIISGLRNFKLQTTSLDAIDRLIGKLLEQKQELLNSYTGVINAAQRHDKRRKIEAIEEDIEALRTERNLGLVAEIGKKHLRWVEQIDNNSKATANEIMMAIRIGNMWAGIEKILYGETYTSSDPELSMLSGKMNKILHSLIGKSRELITDQARGVIRPEDWTEDNLQDVSWNSSRIRSLSAAAQSRVIQHIAGYVETIGRHEDEDVLRLMKELSALEQEMKAYGGAAGLQSVYDKLMQQGEDAWGLALQYSHTWFDWRQKNIAKRNAQLKEVDQSTEDEIGKRLKRKAIWEKFWKETKSKATWVDTTIFFDATTGDFKPNLEEAKKKLAQQVGEEHLETVLARAQERYLKYVEARNTFFELLDDEVANGDKTVEEAQVEKVNFQNRYSPNVFFDQMNGKKSYGPATEKYVTFAPLKTAKDMWNADYQQIMEDEQLSDFYNRYSALMDRLLSYLPQNIQERVGSGFLPIVRKEVLSDSLKLREWVNTLNEQLARSIAASQWQEGQNDKAVNRIPIEHINPKDADIPDRSRDMIGIAKVFGMMALHYKHFSAARDVIEMGETILHEVERTRMSGASQTVQNGQVVTVQKGLRNALDALSYLKEFMVYRKPKSLEKDLGLSIYSERTPEGTKFNLSPIHQNKISQRVRALIRKRDQLQEDYLEQNITLDDYTSQMESLEEELSKYEGFKLYGSKIGDKLIGINQLKNLSYNPFSAVANLTFGIISNFIHAQGNKDFSSAQMRKAMGMMLNATRSTVGIQNETAQKILNIMDRLGVMGDFVDTSYGSKKGALRGDKPGWKKALEPFAMLRTTDYFMKGMTTLAVLLNRKVTVTVDGVEKEINMWEALDKEGQWNSALYGPRPEWSSDTVEEQTEWDKLRNRIVRVNMVIHGNQDKNSPKLVNKNILGRLLGQFRMSWLPEGWYNRFQSERYDEYLERNVKGRYTTLAQIGVGGMLFYGARRFANWIPGVQMDVTRGITLNNGKDLAQSEVDMENMRRNFGELVFYLGLSAAILMIKYLNDDEEDTAAKTALQITINMLIRGKQDISFYASPSVFDQVTRNVIPATQVITDYWKFVKATGRFIIDDEYEFEQWLFKMTKAGLPIPQATLVNKARTLATRDLDQYQ